MGVQKPVISPSFDSIKNNVASTSSEYTPLLSDEECANDLNKHDRDGRNSDTPDSVPIVEEIGTLMSQKSLNLTYFFILLIIALNALQSQITSNLMAYVVSDFSAHSLIPVIGIVSGIMSGILKLPIAKSLDLWGRAEGFALMTLIGSIGLLLMAVCKNVETYAVSQVFHAVGIGGMDYVLQVVITDISSLKNRALAMSLAATPYLATTFAGPKIAEVMFNTIGFRGTFAAFAVITPLVAAPCYWILIANQSKRKETGVLAGRNWKESLVHHTRDFDVYGMLLLSAGLILFLLPFSLTGYKSNSWTSPSILTMISLGIILLLIFVIYERFYAPHPFIPYALLLNRTVLGGCLLCSSRFIAFFCYDGYYTSYLQVVNGLSISQAGYINNIFSIVATLIGLVVGYLIRVTGRFKWVAWIAVPLELVGGLTMAYFRRPYQTIIYVVLAQIFIAVAGGAIVICEQMAVMAVVSRDQLPSALALLSLFASVGGALGSAVSGAIWTNTLPRALRLYLPDYAKPDAERIYEDLALQLSYERGSEVRDAIIAAYGMAQLRMCVAATAVLAWGFVWVGMWRDVRVDGKAKI
ncbi:related to MFS siderophore iron transporter [Rhynchosporium agropyri]|uniref:Related to MFS siderophore iron transporter n=1 Tax=Rhynchosporium agropyri TaxID=914238 RepID=A0A1E1LFD4_9HELO|nr:related to MFS siderophore iron transporter [Rhynchosporium agropyri]